MKLSSAHPFVPARRLAALGLLGLILLQLACVLPFATATPEPQPSATRAAAATGTRPAGASPTPAGEPTSSSLAPRLSPSAAPSTRPAAEATLRPAATLKSQPVTRLDTEKGVMAQLFPEEAQLGAPAWLGGSLRLTYSVASATREKAANGTSTSGSGLLQYDLAAVDGQLVAGSTRFFLDTDLAGTYHPTTPFASWGTPGAGEYWVNPQALKQAESLASDKLTVVRGPATVSGKVYQAVRFEYRDGNNLSIWMVDTETGLIIYYRQQIGADTDAKQTNSILSLVAVRSLKLPWAGTQLPAAVRVGGSLQYAGTQTVVVAGVGAPALRVTLTAKVTQTGQNWAQYQLTDSVVGLQANPRVTGAAQLGEALWLPAEAFKANLNGLSIDSDPQTGAKTSASLKNGLLYLTEAGKAFTTTAGYDPTSGLLVYYRQELVSPTNTTTLVLQKQ